MKISLRVHANGFKQAEFYETAAIEIYILSITLKI